MKKIQYLLVIGILSFAAICACSKKAASGAGNTSQNTDDDKDPLTLSDIYDENRNRLLTPTELKTVHVYNSKEIKMTREVVERSSKVVNGNIDSKEKTKLEILTVPKGTIGSIKKIFGNNTFLVSFSKKNQVFRFYFYLRGGRYYYLSPTDGGKMTYPKVDKTYQIYSHRGCKLLRVGTDDPKTEVKENEAEGDDGT